MTFFPRSYTAVLLLLTSLLVTHDVYGFTFDWGAVTWSPNGSLHHTYPGVDGSTVDVDVNVTGDTNRFTNSTPRIRSYGLQSWPNFVDQSENVVFTYTFSQPVIIRNFSIIDIDGRDGSWADAVMVTALDEGGATIDPDNVFAGSFINQLNGHQFEATDHRTDNDDLRSTVTFDFSNQPITQLSITHYPGAISASDPGGSAVGMTDFDFFYVYDYGDADGYGTARHIRHFNEPWLGNSRGDADLTAPQTNANADADDTDGNDDENGVTFRSPHGGDHAEIYADLQVVNDTGGDVYACAWLDRWDGTGNGGGSFDAGDVADNPAQVCQAVADNAGAATTTTFYWNGLPEVSGHTFARFRVCATLAECQSPTGDATGGEVEDYRIDFDFNPTLAIIENFRVELLSDHDLSALTGANQAGGGKSTVVVRWDTAQEHGTIGFFVECKAPSETSWHRINSATMLPGLINAPQGGEYLLIDSTAVPGSTVQYRLMEEEVWNTSKIYGPWQITLPVRPLSQKRQMVSPAGTLTTQHTQQQWRRLAKGFVGRAKALPEPARAEEAALRSGLPFFSIQGAPTRTFDERFPRGVNRVRFRTRDEAMYHISIEDLSTITGISTTQISKKLLGNSWSFSAGGNPASFYYDQEHQDFIFASHKYQTTETLDNIYSLGEFSKQQGWNMEQVTGAGPDAGLPGQFRERLTFAEENMLLTWVHQDEQADYGYWDYVYAPSKSSAELTIDIPDPAAVSSEPGQLRIVLRGASDTVAGNDHLARVRLNGEALSGEVRWDGNKLAILETTFNQQLLGGSEAGEVVQGIVTVEGEAQNGAQYSLFYIDSVSISYDRKMYARNNSLHLNTPQEGTVTVSGFTTPAIKVIENPNTRNARWRQDLTVQQSVDGYQVSFHAVPGEYMLSSGLLPAVVEPDLPSQILSPGNQAEYLIIAPDVLLESAQALADYRSNRFLTKLVRLQDIYDIFSFGRTDSNAVSRFLTYVYGHWQLVPDYVVLMGRGTLDHPDRLGYGESLLPLKMAGTPWGLIGSDNRYADIDGDHLPEFAIGRIAVSTDVQGLAYVEKIRKYELSQVGQGTPQALLVADNPDPVAGDFHANSNETAGLLENNGFFVEKLYHPDNEIHDGLISSWNQESLALVSYNGHGGRSQLGTHNERFFHSDDVSALHNQDHFPLFSAFTCAVGDSSYPGILGLGDTLSLHDNGGAIASFAPTGLSVDRSALLLGDAWLQALIQDGESIGQAAQQAMSAAKQNGVSDFIIDLYSVSGDPAITISK